MGFHEVLNIKNRVLKDIFYSELIKIFFRTPFFHLERYTNFNLVSAFFML